MFGILDKLCGKRALARSAAKVGFKGDLGWRVQVNGQQENGMNCEQVMFKSCDSESVAHTLRGNNRAGCFYVSITTKSKYSSYSSISLNSVREADSLINCLIKMKETLA